MKSWLTLLALMALVASSPAGAGAQGPLTEEEKQVIRESVKEWMETEGRKPGTMPPTDEEGVSAERPSGPFTGGGTLLGGRTIFAKPFVSTPRAIVGGYMDYEVTDCNGSSFDCSRGLEFDQVRLIPFIYADVTDRIKFATEIELEHGGSDNNQGDGEVKVEFATIDYLIEDWVNFRAGILLSPLGRFNLIHDSPLNDLTLRPLVSRLIIPTTLSESGLGLYGTFYPTRLSKVDYEFYVVQGFDGEKTLFSEKDGLRKSKGSQKADNNENKAILSRVAFSPFLGVEVGGSIHHGKWDNRGHHLTITAVDWTLQRGPFEILGEAAWAGIEGGSPTPSATVPPARMDGFYIQGNYHFMPEFLKRLAPTHFTDASTFTAVVRYGEADTNTQSATNRSDLKRLTLGLNFRPIEDTVFKLSYTFNDEENPADALGTPDNPGQNNGWQFSLATYF